MQEAQAGKEQAWRIMTDKEGAGKLPAAVSRRSWRARLGAAMAIYAQPRVIAMMFLGFSSGLPLALTGQTLSAWLTEEGVSLTSIGLLSMVGLPYTLKFLWAPLIDRLPLGPLTRRFGMRRGWILLTQVVLIAATLVLGFSDPGRNLALVTVMAVCVAFASASQDVVIDAYRVEVLPPPALGAGAAVLVYGYRIAMLVSGAGSLVIAEFGGFSLAYAAMAALLLVGMVTVLLNPEPAHPLEMRRAAGSMAAMLQDAVIGPFAEFLRRPHAVLILLFVVLYKFGDSLAGVMSLPFFLQTGFTKIEIAEIAKFFGFWATMGGLALGGWLMAAVGLYRALWIAGILQLLSNLGFALLALWGKDITALAVVIAFENLSGGMGTAIFVAYLSSLCNLAYTATQYALLSSFMATARTLLSASGGAMAEYLGWPLFFAATALAALPGLALLAMITRRVAPVPGSALSRKM